MRAVQKVPTATDQYGRVTPTDASTKDYGPLEGTGLHPNRTQAEEKERRAKHDAACEEAAKEWRRRAEEKDWDSVRAPLSVYDYSGAKVEKDPRRSDEYRTSVLVALGYDEYRDVHKANGMTTEDFAVIQEVSWRRPRPSG